MATEIRVPALGESVTEATVAKWIRQAGEGVAADEPLVELETDKVTLEVNAPAAGTLAEITIAEGATVEVGALLGVIAEGAAPAVTAAATTAAATAAPTVTPAPRRRGGTRVGRAAAPGRRARRPRQALVAGGSPLGRGE